MTVVEAETGRCRMRLVVTPMGGDLSIALSGGDAPHIGAVALAVPHPGLRHRERTDASVSLLALTGHKEDGLARRIARTFATAMGCTVCAACGVHLDNAEASEISDILDLAEAMARDALDRIRHGTPA
ncbi:MAG: hypothetical protein AB7D39_09630 [Pseudodesulfovibrio sp.]|uniref:prenylated flavin chaperone LpdD n=1 Tax=Pseudodesulfovibrio sp. TaxID=2035812 RepID=UPI003D14F0B7